MNKIYNLRQEITCEKMNGRSPVQNHLYLAIEHNYIVCTNMDNDGQLMRFLIANPTIIKFIRTWSYVAYWMILCIKETTKNDRFVRLLEHCAFAGYDY